MQDVEQEHENSSEPQSGRKSKLPPASPRPSVHDHCLVCYSDLHHTGIIPCGHNEICGVCHLRLRHLHDEVKCPMCKTVNDRIIVDRPGKVFDEYEMWGDELGAEYVFKEDVGMFFPKEYYHNDILPLFGYHCTAPNCPYDGVTPDENIYEKNNSGKQQNKKAKTPLRHLQDHLRNKHRLALCQLCVEFKRDFVSLLPRFTPNQLKKHSQKGDGAGSGFKGHPVCEFCRPKRFYDLTQLHSHLQKDHYKCHVCEKQGRHNQFFRNYASLERHFDKEHYLCHDVQCMAARFVVFENEIDLRGHELSTHGGTSTGSTKIQLEFRVRRAGHDGAGVAQDVPTDEDFSYGLDGQAFVPEALPQSEEGSSHPLHVARTAEIRAQAELVRQSQAEELKEEAFPSLNNASHDSGGIRMGWTADGIRTRTQAGQVTTEQFPSLPKASKKSVAAQIRGKPKGGASATAAAISSASWKRAGGAAPRPTAAAFPPSSFTSAPSSSSNRESNLMPDNFPALAGPSPRHSAAASASSAAARNRESSLKADNFPALGRPSGTAPRYAAAEAFAKKNQTPGASRPSLSNPNDFPPPPTLSSSSTNNVKQKMMGEQKAPSKEALGNFLKFPPPSSQDSITQGRATTEQMKAALGPSKYKRLKNLTKDFAMDEITPESYVDQAAALFDSGYDDSDFWSFVPGLLQSCPNESSSQQAIRYMNQLRSNMPDFSSAAATSNSGWASLPAAASPYPAYPATLARPLAPASTKKKNAWNAGSSSSVARAKAPPGSVAAKAAQQEPQMGTATKYMAKEKKQQQKQGQQGGGNKKSQKKKQKDELRALAFGK